jgi:hypothetical protein
VFVFLHAGGRCAAAGGLSFEALPCIGDVFPLNPRINLNGITVDMNHLNRFMWFDVPAVAGNEWNRVINNIREKL